ncbi:hypothetical protein AB0D08_24185 [Kitasatospora sp. NPDC048540]|uniref:hypothetical protein n=1 Tax=unclassified Kitasatospora TaxID=2633591 RepID=UPI001314CC7B|nr:hypothetical protein [Kitasatospora sp. MBT63]
MSDMQDRMNDKAERDTENVRAADPEEGITSYQNAHAQEMAPAEGDPMEETQEGGRS